MATQREFDYDQLPTQRVVVYVHRERRLVQHAPLFDVEHVGNDQRINVVSKTKQIRSYTCNLTGTGWGKRSYHRSKFHWHLSSVNVAPLLPIHPIRPWIHHSPLLLSIVLLFQCWDRLFFSKAYNIVDLHFSLQRQCETVVTYRSMSQLSKTFNYCEWWNWYSPDWTGFFTIDIQLASGG